MFWAEAVATEVRSVVTVMPVMSMLLTPRLKRVWRQINKAKGPPSCAPTIPRRTISQYLQRRAGIRLKNARGKTLERGPPHGIRAATYGFSANTSYEL